jgi:hypothetical protein
VRKPRTNLRQGQGHAVHLLRENAVRQRQVGARRRICSRAIHQQRDKVFLRQEKIYFLSVRKQISCSSKYETCSISIQYEKRVSFVPVTQQRDVFDVVANLEELQSKLRVSFLDVQGF